MVATFSLKFGFQELLISRLKLYHKFEQYLLVNRKLLSYTSFTFYQHLATLLSEFKNIKQFSVIPFNLLQRIGLDLNLIDEKRKTFTAAN